MAEIVKAKERKELVKIEDKNQTKENKKNEKKSNKTLEEKKGLWGSFMTFCNGVKSEFGKVCWTSKKDMFKYSIATIVFILFCSVFFYGIDTLYALIQSLFN